MSEVIPIKRSGSHGKLAPSSSSSSSTFKSDALSNADDLDIIPASQSLPRPSQDRTQPRHLDKTVRRSQKPSPDICLYPGCTRQFAGSFDLDRHVRTHLPDPVTRLDCPKAGPGGFCGRAGSQGFTRQDHLNEHLRKVHFVNLPTSLQGRRELSRDDHTFEANTKKQLLRAVLTGKSAASIRDPVNGLDPNRRLESTSSNNNDHRSETRHDLTTHHSPTPDLRTPRTDAMRDDAASPIKSLAEKQHLEQESDVPGPVWSTDGSLPIGKDVSHERGSTTTDAGSLATDLDTLPHEAKVVPDTIRLCDSIMQIMEDYSTSQKSPNGADIEPFCREVKTLCKFLRLVDKVYNVKEPRRLEMEERHLQDVAHLLTRCHRTLLELHSSLLRSSNQDPEKLGWYVPASAVPWFYLIFYNRTLEITIMGINLLHRWKGQLQINCFEWEDLSKVSQILLMLVKHRRAFAGDRHKESVEEVGLLRDVEHCIKSAEVFPTIARPLSQVLSDMPEVLPPEPFWKDFTRSSSSRSNLDAIWDANDGNESMEPSSRNTMSSYLEMDGPWSALKSATSSEGDDAPEIHNDPEGRFSLTRNPHRITSLQDKHAQREDALEHLRAHREDTGAIAEDVRSASLTTVSHFSSGRFRTRASSITTVPDDPTDETHGPLVRLDPLRDDRSDSMVDEKGAQYSLDSEGVENPLELHIDVYEDSNESVSLCKHFMTGMLFFFKAKHFMTQLWNVSPRCVSNLANMISPEPPLASGKTRIVWTCTCGCSMYDDFIELRPGAAEKMKAALDAPNHQRSSGPDLTSSNHPSPGQSSGRVPTGGSATPLAGLPSANNHLSAPPYDPRPMHSRSASTTITCGPESRWLLVCAQAWQRPASLLHLNVCSTTSDQQLFTELSELYMSLKKAWWHRLSLKAVRSIRYVQFELHPKDLVDVRKVPDMPPESRKEEYLYQACDLIPPIGENLMTHLFHHPHEANERAITFLRSPKKLKERLAVCPQMGTNLGWGIHLVEGWAMTKVWLLAMAMFLSSSLVFAITWSVLEHDLQGAFAVAAYFVTLAGLGIGTLQAYTNQI